VKIGSFQQYSVMIPTMLISYQQSIISLGLKLGVFLKYYSSKGLDFYALGMASLLGTTKQEEPLPPLDTNVATKSVSRKQREKIQKVDQILGQTTWIWMNFT
jgi:hypothetical protein